ncbi:MAG: hypothetical protein J5U19_12045, partial [Candidatus Methanoperedens sp.]|nr:hypothetical protein [Candidatus Methanoperedens sp.]
MKERSIDIALTQSEAGKGLETIYENVCTLATEHDLCFNYATTDDLKNWGFLEGCFSTFLMGKKDIIIQVITTYRNQEGASSAYKADADYLKKHHYGKKIENKQIGDASIMLMKKQNDGTTYNLLFLKDNVFAAV